MKKFYTVALAGNPNAGKTTLFNALTGARQHVGNYPGVTVEKKQGIYYHHDHELYIVDLPGTYSLTAYSMEEVVARNFLVNDRPEAVIDILDASNLERNLYLAVQFLELGIPLCIALNMIDVAKSRGIEIKADKLSELLGVPVIPTIARNGKGKNELMDTVVSMINEKREHRDFRISYGDDIDGALIEMEKIIVSNDFLTGRYPSRWVALKYLESDEQIISFGRLRNPGVAAILEEIVGKVSTHVQKTLEIYPEALITDHRYGFINSILKEGVVQVFYDQDRLYTSDRMDRVLTHRFMGPLIMLAVLLGLYKFTFSYSEIPIGWLEGFFGWLNALASGHLPEGVFKSLMISGVIDGVGGVLGFVPLIMFMFFGIAILEDSGYLARVAYMLDRLFRIFGLHGSSVMPFIISGGIAGGCAVPGVFAARTLKSTRERMATLLTVPFMNCGAKLPVFALLISAFFVENEAGVMFLLTLISWAGALLVAKFLRSTVIRGVSTPFVMELPPYRFPTFKGLLIHTWERTWHYIRKAGTVILGISILLWAMMSFPGLPEDKSREFEMQREKILLSVPESILGEIKSDQEASLLSSEARVFLNSLDEINRMEGYERLKHSICGRIGIALEKVTRLAGFEWRTNIALIGGFAAKEVIVSTLGTAYSLSKAGPEKGQNRSLSRILADSPGWSPLMAFSLIIFTMFYSPCLVTIVAIVRESGSWKWGVFSMTFNTVLAFILAVIIFQAGSGMGY
ncbi:MAG: ferrous iron transport protein B [Deltaproteobacteria bacterium]|nr:ferrous iron transport protein B [Deltaproteobacteria bacterium]